MKIYDGDFEFIKLDNTGGHEDYWFKLHGDTKQSLTEKTMEQSMMEAIEVVYSKDEDVVGVKRLFPFNWDVVSSDDRELKNVLRKLAGCCV